MAGQPGQNIGSASKKDSAIRRKKRKSGQFSRSGDSLLSRENSMDGLNQASQQTVEEDGATATEKATSDAEGEGKCRCALLLFLLTEKHTSFVYGPQKQATRAPFVARKWVVARLRCSHVLQFRH